LFVGTKIVAKNSIKLKSAIKKSVEKSPKVGSFESKNVFSDPHVLAVLRPELVRNGWNLSLHFTISRRIVENFEHSLSFDVKNG
jgi:hypothetical protein